MADSVSASRPTDARTIRESRPGAVLRRAANGLCLAAAPTFAVMALVSAHVDSQSAMLCVSTLHASPLSGMVVMYLLMSVFHLPPWLTLLAGRQDALA